MRYKIKYSDVKGGSTSEIEESINLNSLDSLVKYQLIATDHLTEGSEGMILLQSIRDGACTRKIEKNCLKCESIPNINLLNPKFLELATLFRTNYLVSLDSQPDFEYFYVFRFIGLDPKFINKKILYPTIFSTSWNLDFVKDWAYGSIGFIQRIRVKNNAKFITTSYPKKETDDFIIKDNDNYFITIEERLKKVFLEKNDNNKNIIGENNKDKTNIMNQGEQEVLLPPGVTKYLGIFSKEEFITSDIEHKEIKSQIKICDYEFEETPENLMEERVHISCEKGTIFDIDEVI